MLRLARLLFVAPQMDRGERDTVAGGDIDRANPLGEQVGARISTFHASDCGFAGFGK